MPRINLNDNSFGALMMTGASLSFVVNDFLMKSVFDDLSIFQAILLRGLFVCPILLFFCLKRNQLVVPLNAKDWKIISFRTLLEILITFSFIYALANLTLAHVTAILQSVPLILTFIGAVVLSEPVGWRRWLAVCFGFVGVLLIIKPGLDGFSIFSLSALGSAILISIRDVITRGLSANAPSLFVAFITAVAITLAGGLFTLTIPWQTPSASNISFILAAAFALPVAYFLSIAAVRVGDVSFVTPFRYTAVLFATLLTALFEQKLPDYLTVVGAIIVVSAGIYCIKREALLEAK